MIGGQLHLALDLIDEMLQLGYLEVTHGEWKASVPPTIGLLPTKAYEQRTALVGDHVSAFPRARLADRRLQPSSFRLVNVLSSDRSAMLGILAILRRGGMASMKRAKLGQNPCRPLPGDLENT